MEPERGEPERTKRKRVTVSKTERALRQLQEFMNGKEAIGDTGRGVFGVVECKTRRVERSATSVRVGNKWQASVPDEPSFDSKDRADVRLETENLFFEWSDCCPIL